MIESSHIAKQDLSIPALNLNEIRNSINQQKQQIKNTQKKQTSKSLSKLQHAKQPKKIYTVYDSLQDNYIELNLQPDLGSLNNFLDINKAAEIDHKVFDNKKSQDKYIQKIEKKKKMEHAMFKVIKQSDAQEVELDPIEILKNETETKKLNEASKRLIDQMVQKVFGISSLSALRTQTQEKLMDEYFKLEDDNPSNFLQILLQIMKKIVLDLQRAYQDKKFEERMELFEKFLEKQYQKELQVDPKLKQTLQKRGSKSSLTSGIQTQLSQQHLSYPKQKKQQSDEKSLQQSSSYQKKIQQLDDKFSLTNSQKMKSKFQFGQQQYATISELEKEENYEPSQQNKLRVYFFKVASKLESQFQISENKDLMKILDEFLLYIRCKYSYIDKEWHRFQKQDQEQTQELHQRFAILHQNKQQFETIVNKLKKEPYDCGEANDIIQTEIFLSEEDQLIIWNSHIDSMFIFNLYKIQRTFYGIMRLDLVNVNLNSLQLMLLLEFINFECNTLSYIDLSYNKLDKRNAYLVSQICQFNPLKVLKLFNCQLSTQLFCIICLGIIKNNAIQHLYLKGNLIDDLAISTLESLLRYINSLVTIDLQDNKITKFEQLQKAVLYNKVRKHQLIIKL